MLLKAKTVNGKRLMGRDAKRTFLLGEATSRIKVLGGNGGVPMSLGIPAS